MVELVNYGKIRGLAPVRGNRLEGSPALEQERAEVAFPHVLLLFRLLFYFVNQSAYVFTVKYRSLFIDY